MLEKQRLSDTNLSQYAPGYRNEEKTILDIKPLLQNDYGGDQDCTLTSITTVIKWFKPDVAINTIYNEVERIAKKHLYRLNYSTMSIVMKSLYNQSLRSFGLRQKVCSRYIKDVGYCYNFLKSEINKNHPILLSLWKDGRDYYKNHSVLIVGYVIIGPYRFLQIYDNWSKGISYIDYDKLSAISSIHFLT